MHHVASTSLIWPRLLQYREPGIRAIGVAAISAVQRIVQKRPKETGLVGAIVAEPVTNADQEV